MWPERRFTHIPETQPRHVGAPLRVGELVLLRRPDTSFDLKVELRAIDRHMALVHFAGLDTTERVPLAWLRRPETLR